MNDFYKVFQALMRTFVLKKQQKVWTHTVSLSHQVPPLEQMKQQKTKAISTMPCSPSGSKIEDKKDKKDK